VRLAPGAGVELRANWARASRAPDFLELFGQQGSVLGNAALRPEHAENWDAGASWSCGARGGLHAAAEWAHYQSRSRDLIVYVRNSASTARAENVTRARIRGEELSVRLGARAVAVAANLTWQTSIDLGDVPAWRGRRLPMRPERQVSARIDWTHGPLRAAADVQVIGENYLNRANRERVPRRALAGASLSAERSGVRVVLEGRNLGDQRAADVGGFPLPGRSLFLSCQVRLGGEGGRTVARHAGAGPATAAAAGDDAP
jgi:iron complex outermembrane receptor protein